MNLESWHSSEDKARWRLVRTDTYSDVPGAIISANETSGECTVSIAKPDGSTETKSLSFGIGGIRIVGRRR